MAANNNPIYCATGNITVGTTIATANTAKDGTGTVVTSHTAGANGSRVEKVRFRALGTNVATVVRCFINNGATNATATNNVLFEELTLPSTTLSEVAQLLTQEMLLNIVLPAGYKLNFTVGTTVAAGYAITVVSGDY